MKLRLTYVAFGIFFIFQICVVGDIWKVPTSCWNWRLYWSCNDAICPFLRQRPVYILKTYLFNSSTVIDIFFGSIKELETTVRMIAGVSETINKQNTTSQKLNCKYKKYGGKRKRRNFHSCISEAKEGEAVEASNWSKVSCGTESDCVYVQSNVNFKKAQGEQQLGSMFMEGTGTLI